MQFWKEVEQVALLSVISLVVLFLTSRFCGKRQISEMSLFDYVNAITVGSIAAELATELENWHQPLTALLVYGVCVWLAHWLACKSLWGRRLLCGRAVTLMEHGVIHSDALQAAFIDLNEFLAQCRIAGYFDLNTLDSVILETNGQFSFLPISEQKPTVPKDFSLNPPRVSLWLDLILDGKILQENLKRSGRDYFWLTRQLQQRGIGQVSEAYYAGCDHDGNFYACRRSQTTNL